MSLLKHWNKLVFLLQSACFLSPYPLKVVMPYSTAQVMETFPSSFLIYLTSLLCHLHSLKHNIIERFESTLVIQCRPHPRSHPALPMTLTERETWGGMVSNHSNQKGYVRTNIDCSEDEYFHHKCNSVAIVTLKVSLCRQMGCNAGWTLASCYFGQIPSNQTNYVFYRYDTSWFMLCY